MKKLLIMLLSLLICMAFTGCVAKTAEENTTEAPTAQSAPDYDAEVASVRADTTISNKEKIDRLGVLTQKQITRAENYRILIKDVFKSRSESSSFYSDVDFSLDSADGNIDAYCDYLRNEFDANLLFFNDCAIIKYEYGTAGSTYLANKEYELAKEYADKLEAVYLDICG